MTSPHPGETPPIVPSILEVIGDPALFGPAFGALSWHAWVLCAAALFGLTDGLQADDRAFILRCLGRQQLPTSPAREGWILVGRRGGKSRFASLLAVYLACFLDHSKVLTSGERGVVMVIASDRRQARVVMGYMVGLLDSVPMLEALIERRTAEAVHLTNGVSIEVHTASFRTVRGYTVVAAVLDEIAFWPTDDAASPDREIIGALRPAMATVPAALMLAISSPYARRGELWRAYERHFGQDDDPVLFWKADTRTMNGSVSAALLQAAVDDDPVAAASEYGAEFRSDLETLFSPEVLRAARPAGCREQPPLPDVPYYAFVDPSGGSADSMTLAIAHWADGLANLDLVREERPPFSPDRVVKEFSDVLRPYRVHAVVGDRYAGEWPAERFRAHGLTYKPSPRTKSEIYLALLPAINSGRVALLDDDRLLTQLSALERRTGRLGRDSVDHPPRAHDDLANAAAGALVGALARPASMTNRQIFAINLEPAARRQWRPVF